jgi:IclR family acetate operon transcriptional repressor
VSQAKDVPAVATSVRIIELLDAQAPAAPSAGAIARELGINRSTCYGILATLQRRGWVEQSPPGGPGWVLGPGFRRLSSATSRDVIAVLQRELDRFAEETGLMAFAARQQPDGDYVAVARAAGRGPVRIAVEPGDSFAWAAPALLQSFLAWAPDDERDAALATHTLTAFTVNTIVERDALLEELAVVRERGFALSMQQFDLAQSGVAAPVFDPAGRVAYALCSLAFSSELTDDNVTPVAEALREAAQRATARSGGRWPS